MELDNMLYVSNYHNNISFNGINYIHYIEYNKNYLDVIGFEDNVKDIIIPDNIDGVPVIRWSLDKIETEKIKNHVRSIDFGSIKEFGNHSFTGFDKLETVLMSSQVTSVPLFDNCKSLKSFIIKNGSTLDVINERTFFGCEMLKEVVLPHSLKSYASFIFEFAPNIKKINFLFNDNSIEVIERNDVEKEIEKRHRKQRIDLIKSYANNFWDKLCIFSWEGLPFLISMVILIGIIVYYWHDIFSYQHNCFESIAILACIVLFGGFILLVVAFVSTFINISIKEMLSTENFFLGLLSSILSFPLSCGVCYILLFILAQFRNCSSELDEEDEEPIHIRWDGPSSM